MRRPFARLCLCTLIAALAACGGGEGAPPPPPLGAGPRFPVTPPCSTVASPEYSLGLKSASGPVTGNARVMQAYVTLPCAGGTLSGLAIDWTVSGGGLMGGQTMARTLTNSDGIATVTWDFAPGTGLQTIEAEYRGGPTPRRVAISHTVLPIGPNHCATAGGTDVGVGRTITSDETWTKAASPYFTSCPTAAACDAPVRVTGGATLTIEPGAVVCVDRIRTEGSSRIVAIGTASEPIFFGVRDRAAHWKGMQLDAPASGALVNGPSILTHAIIENASDIKALGHPIVVEDSLMRRVLPAAQNEHCASFSVQPHSVSGVAPSRVLRTVIDGLGGSPNFNSPVVFAPCPAVSVEVVDNQPMTLSARIINSRDVGMRVRADFSATFPGQVLLTNCEISGSAATGLSAEWTTPRVSSCNIEGNLLGANALVQVALAARLDARSNWWGDPAGPQAPKANDIAGEMDASNPLTAPVNLGY